MSSLDRNCDDPFANKDNKSQSIRKSLYFTKDEYNEIIDYIKRHDALKGFNHYAKYLIKTGLEVKKNEQ